MSATPQEPPSRRPAPVLVPVPASVPVPVPAPAVFDPSAHAGSAGAS